MQSRSTRRLILKGGLILAVPCTPIAATEYTLFSRTSLSANEGIGFEKWRSGHLISTDTSDPKVVTFTTTAGDGNVSAQFAFAPPDISRTWVYDFDLDKSGAIFFSGESFSLKGQLAPFIGVKTPDVPDVKLFRTLPYWPRALCAAPDGTIWTAGFEMLDGKASGPGIDPNYNVVRRFDRSGKLIGSAVPRHSLKRPESMVTGHLFATSKKVGWYSPRTGAGTYIELSPDLRSSYQEYAGMPGPFYSGEALGFVLTDSDEAFLTWRDHSGDITTCKFDRVAGAWASVTSPVVSGSKIRVLRGEENGLLVFRNGTSIEFIEGT